MSPKFKTGQTVQVTWGEYKGCYATVKSFAPRGLKVDVQGQEGCAGRNLFYLYERVREVPWQLGEHVMGLVRIRHSDGERFVLTMPEMAQEICDKLNQL